MPKMIEIEYPDLGIVMTATLWEDKNQKLCKLLWDNLPIETIQSHALASGEQVFAPIKIRAVETGAYFELESKQEPGKIFMYTQSYSIIGWNYGPVTEPAPSAVIGRIREEDLEKLKLAGRAAWDANFMTHFPLRVVFRRKEGQV